MVEMPDIARLTPEERLELIGRLWDSLESGDVRLTPSQDAELGRRMATFDADAKTAVPWEEIEADLIRRSSGMLRVRFTADARADLNDALDWYETHAPEIASQFRNALRVVVARIAENPRQFPASAHQTRRALLRRFPYLVFFRETDAAIYVVAVFHTSRDPTTWRRAS